MSIQNLILGSLVSRGADRLLNPAKYRENQFNILTGGGITGQGDEETSKGPTTFGGIAKQGIMSLIAQAILGPVFGPLALTVGQNFAAKKGLGFFEKPSGPTIQPEDVRGTFTGEGMQFADVQDTLGSMDSGTDIDYNTGDITNKSTGEVTGNVYDEVAISTPSPAPAYDYDDSSSDSGSNGGGGGGSPGSSGPGGSDEMGSFRYGGLASLYR